jgi:hypothetical protein
VLRIRIRDPVPFWPLDPDPGSGIGFFPDLGSRIPTPYFLELSDKFLYNACKWENTIWKFSTSISLKTTIYALLSSAMLCENHTVIGGKISISERGGGSGMGKNQDPGSVIFTLDPDPQHFWFIYIFLWTGLATVTATRRVWLGITVRSATHRTTTLAIQSRKDAPTFCHVFSRLVGLFLIIFSQLLHPRVPLNLVLF